MQNAPEGPGQFPFPAADNPPPVEGTARPEAEAKEKAAVDVPAASGRRVSVVEQFIRNREGSRGARFLGIADRIGALFVNPNSPEGRAQMAGGPKMVMLRSLFNLFDAIKGNGAGTSRLRAEFGVGGETRPVTAGGPEGQSPDAQAIAFLRPILANEPVDVTRLPSPQLLRLAELARQLGPETIGFYVGVSGQALADGVDFKTFCNTVRTTPRGQRTIQILVDRMFGSLNPEQKKAKVEQLNKALTVGAALPGPDAAIFEALARTAAR